MRRFAATLIALLCCNINAAYAATERVTAVLADGSIQLSSSGKSLFTNTVFVQPNLAQAWLTEHALYQSN
ncbi:MAG: hypothetical protein ACOYNL_08160 [Rickettsiales bacterium]